MKYLAEVWRPPMQTSCPPRGLRSRSQEGNRSVVVVLAVENSRKGVEDQSVEAVEDHSIQNKPPATGSWGA